MIRMAVTSVNNWNAYKINFVSDVKDSVLACFYTLTNMFPDIFISR